MKVADAFDCPVVTAVAREKFCILRAEKRTRNN